MFPTFPNTSKFVEDKARRVFYWELKKPRRQLRGQRRLKYDFIFYLRISRYPKVIYFVYHCQS